MASNSPSLFLDLPAELCLRIYHDVISSFSPSSLGFIGKGQDHEPTNILQTCRQIRAEANVELAKVLEVKQSEALAVEKMVSQELVNPEAKFAGLTDELEAVVEFQGLMKKLGEVRKASGVIEVLKVRSQKRGAEGKGSSASAAPRRRIRRNGTVGAS